MSDDGLKPTGKKRSSCLLVGLIVFALLAGGVGAFVWWQNRPIEPVQLSGDEKAVVEEKVEAIQSNQVPASADTVEDEGYQPGTKELVLTERELNGLLNEQTSLGDKVRFDLNKDSVIARIDTDLDPDVPMIGGKRLKMKVHFIMKHDEDGPSFVIDDVSIWGISLPNDWLGGIKGRDLIAESIGADQGLAGVESIKVESGEIRIKLKE